ncbi:conserved hypothetical protein [Methylocella silvestris BL2]|uniref:Uncharacterized protein n=1 Tax=Methylocella silvestris (strain DSM 15510 / CIP 108128 / LMG 27833 / NCIMB 13906 / BL2) TaxID=395965 RepID=B8ELT8_METSB|nr:hypothetical protein [Methylocella silvestris]ACK50719.1 conserved hypothetical protein [Methylocella silvestris BL2]
MSEIVGFAAKASRAFGALAAIAIGGQPMRLLTRDEASILSRAIEAVAVGASPERQIFMSPIASDQDFDALAQENGISIAADGCADVFLDWPHALALAKTLRSFADMGTESAL